MPNYFDSKGNSISLVKEVNRSGEGVIWETNRKGCLAKIYHQPTSEKIGKLKVMVANPPDDPMKGKNRVSIAWAIDLIKDNRNNYVGFLMPKIINSVQLLEVYNSKLRNKKFPNFNWYCLHITALNLASIINALHIKNYIVGDMKAQNILVNGSGQVSIVDTDSFQVVDLKTNTVYRCPVGSEGFTPAELIGKDIKTVTQTRYHDRFRLGVIIYHLLFTHHPFMGAYKGNGDPPGQDESISKGFWPYNPNSQIQPSVNTIALDIVHPEVKKCFLKCFNEGHTNGTKRPSPQDWVNALNTAIKDLTACSNINNHIYSPNYGKCYWCERSGRLGVDIFPRVNNPILPPKPSIITSPPVPPIVHNQPQITVGVIIVCVVVIGILLLIIF